MSTGSRWTLPNIITILRIVACPAIFLLALSPSTNARFGAFVLFLVAAFSDMWDGYLARKYGWITDFGKLLDPLADKLLLVATFVPFFIGSQRPGELGDVPWWGPLPVWVMIVIFGRELTITLLRSWASRKGTIISAGRSGKYKALFQSLFSGSLLLWYPLQVWANSGGWDGPSWRAWSVLHEGWVGLTLGIAIVLTVYSMFDYLWSYRSLVGGGIG